jgi:hypothetical protein
VKVGGILWFEFYGSVYISDGLEILFSEGFYGVGGGVFRSEGEY